MSNTQTPNDQPDYISYGTNGNGSLRGANVSGSRRTVDGMYRTGDPVLTIAHLVNVIGMYDLAPEDVNGAYFWMNNTPVVWMTVDGEVNVDLTELVLISDETVRGKFYQVIGWCVANRIPSQLHGETSSRRAWRP